MIETVYSRASSLRESFHDWKKSPRGMTLIELVIVIVISGILVSVALRSGLKVADQARLEQTRQGMDALAEAIAGRPDLYNAGVRSDFGYIGDIGAMPPNLDALHANPGGYATWNGPYIENRFTQITNDYKLDAWGTAYSYIGGASITSTGSGGNVIRRLAGSIDELLRNRVSGNVLDTDGTPPGSGYADSVAIRLTIPNGSGTTIIKSTTTDPGGYFQFDSIPIGNHDLNIIYLPDNDTIKRFVSVIPGSELYAQYNLNDNVWTAAGGGGSGLTKVTGSDSLYADCHGLFFWIENNSGSSITIDSVTLTWTSPTAYYRYVKWDGTTVFDSTNPKAGSGENVAFSTPQTINDGASVRVDFDTFEASPTGGSNVDVNNSSFTVRFSDGSEMTISTGTCP